MELAAILILPALASAVSLSPLGRYIAAPATLVATAAVLALAISVAANAAHTGRIDALDEWLTCDGLGALVLLLVAFVEFTAALFSWGYIRRRAGQPPSASCGTITASITCSSCRCSRCRSWRTSR
jgi:formate hydrogenlyase subunit 3/multisubunit Na+/H+ antiporter MnhD subunit